MRLPRRNLAPLCGADRLPDLSGPGLPFRGSSLLCEPVGGGQMRTLFMHVGLHKTGTTVIQKFLHDNAEELENNGVYFPRIGLLSSAGCSYGHHDLAWSLKNDTAEDMWGELRREVRNHSAAVVSSEEFEFVRNSKFYDVVKSLFHGWTIVPVCYLRRQDELLQSEYNQYIKDSRGVLDIGAFSKILANRLDYRIYLEILEESFGKNNIKLRIYDKNHLKGDIFSDFLETLGIAGSGSFRRPIGTINPSRLLKNRCVEHARRPRRRARSRTRFPACRPRGARPILCPRPRPSRRTQPR